MFDLPDHIRNRHDEVANKRFDSISFDADKASNTWHGASEAKRVQLDESQHMKARHQEEINQYHSKGFEAPENVRARHARERESMDTRIADSDFLTQGVRDEASRTKPLAEMTRHYMVSTANVSPYRPKPNPRKGESDSAYVQRLRSEQDTKRYKRAETAAARIPRGDAKAQAKDRLRGEYFGKPIVDVNVSKDGAFARLPLVHVNAEPRGHGLPVAPDLTGIYVRQNWDEICAEIDRHVDEAYDASDALEMTPEQKRKTLEKLDSEILELEHLECEAIWAARARGEVIPFRPDTDVRAVIGLKGPAPKKRR